MGVGNELRKLEAEEGFGKEREQGRRKGEEQSETLRIEARSEDRRKWPREK